MPTVHLISPALTQQCPNADELAHKDISPIPLLYRALEALCRPVNSSWLSIHIGRHSGTDAHLVVALVKHPVAP